MTEENIFYFISKEVTFEETQEKGAIIEATVMELEKVSEGNSRLYQIEEGEEIAKSLKGKPVYHGTNAVGKHDNPLMDNNSKKEPVGFVEKAWVVGKKIKATIRIFEQGIIETLKQGVKYLFSVGGKAISETIKKIGDKFVHILHGARCHHLQILDAGTPVGFPEAKMEKLIEINETVMLCEGGLCHCGEPSKPKRLLNIVNIDRTIEVTGSGIKFVKVEEE